MAQRSITRWIGYIAAPTAATAYGIHLGLTHLEAKYPSLPPEAAGSKALRTPSNPSTQRCAYTDIYAARIPLHALAARARPGTDTDSPPQSALEDAWARAVLGSTLLTTEASLAGLVTHGRYTPGDTGASPAGFTAAPETGAPRALLNGLLRVQREIGADADSNGLLVAWRMADAPRVFFERIARWGYPWRLVSGGRHEMSVSAPFAVQGGGVEVEVRFAAAHDYEVVDGEGEGDAQKILPAWTNRLHRGYARLILDCAAREVEGKRAFAVWE
ncbi:uncharacterized protein N7459_000575 [Penicillium hispanicum]|uniref:uncharacterized protein n=1 Tax=Penicillium hispanicum TaxID=1080232 RepID=UPI0025407469|nr:uncharacterized protein N7459_000575 [Penicillium hispanicum]KAJ5594367.1 hypothetical protein N7459_000575 [Penicillium hispanicum]